MFSKGMIWKRLQVCVASVVVSSILWGAFLLVDNWQAEALVALTSVELCTKVMGF